MGDVQTAVERYRALETEAQDLHRLLMAAHDEVSEKRSETRKLTEQLREAKAGDKFGRPAKPEQIQDMEAQLEAAQRRYEQAQQRNQELKEQFDPVRKLADSCREFLESGGASIEALEAGVPIPRRQGKSLSLSS